MGMVRAFNLVLDKDLALACRVRAEDVRPEGAYSALLRVGFQIEPDGFAKQGDVFFTRKPRRKVGGFPWPGGSKIDAFKAAESFGGHCGSLPQATCASTSSHVIALLGSRVCAHVTFPAPLADFPITTVARCETFKSFQYSP